MSKGSNVERVEQQFILNGDLWKVMVRLSWPAIIAMVLYGLNAVIAAVFVGRYIRRRHLPAYRSPIRSLRSAPASAR